MKFNLRFYCSQLQPKCECLFLKSIQEFMREFFYILMAEEIQNMDDIKLIELLIFLLDQVEEYYE